MPFRVYAHIDSALEGVLERLRDQLRTEVEAGRCPDIDNLQYPLHIRVSERIDEKSLVSYEQFQRDVLTTFTASVRLPTRARVHASNGILAIVFDWPWMSEICRRLSQQYPHLGWNTRQYHCTLGKGIPSGLLDKLAGQLNESLAQFHTDPLISKCFRISIWEDTPQQSDNPLFSWQKRKWVCRVTFHLSPRLSPPAGFGLP